MTDPTATAPRADDLTVHHPIADDVLDAIATGSRPGRAALVCAIVDVIATLPAASRPVWTVTADDAEPVLLRALANVLTRRADADHVSAAGAWERVTAA